MEYREEKNRSKVYKQEYLSGIEKVIAERQRSAEKVRTEYSKDIFSNPQKHRNELKKMLGWPLVEHTADGLPEVTSELLGEEDGYVIERMRFEILDGLKMTGLIFKVSDGKQPLVIVQHGGMGSPEIMAGFYGHTANYNDMLHRVRKYGVNVFAPQLLIWDQEDYEVDYDRKAVDARLKRVGSSITALEIYGISRILDYFETQDYVTNFGMVGLSYGGFYTLYTAAIDERIKSCISCSFFNMRDEVPWSDWTWFKSAEMFDDAEVACLVYPRKLCIEIGTVDQFFDCNAGIRSFERLKEICKDIGTEWMELKVFEGKHEFYTEDDPIEKLIAEIY